MFFNGFNEHMREIFLQDIDKHDILAWIIYSTNYNPKGYNGLKLHQCYITNSTVAKDTKIDKSKVQRILKTLENAGYFKYFVKSEGGKKPSIIDVIFLTWNDAVDNVVNNEVSDAVNNAVQDIENTIIEGLNDIVNDVVTDTVSDTVSDISSKKESKKESKKRNKDINLEVLIDNYTSNNELKDTIIDFLEMRKSIKSPLTDVGLKRMLNQITKLADEDSEKIEILEQSIINSWKGVFPLKEKKSKAHDPVEEPKGKVLDFKIGGE